MVRTSLRRVARETAAGSSRCCGSTCPNVTCEITKRALLFEFHEPLTFEGGIVVDPSVDLIVGLDLVRNAPGVDPQHRAPRVEPIRSYSATPTCSSTPNVICACIERV